MKILLLPFFLLGVLVSGGVLAVGQQASNYWGLGIYSNIDDLIGVDADGNRTYNPNTGYGTNCTFDRATNTRSAGCGFNPSGKRDAMQFNYDSGGGMINQVGFFSDGRISIDSISPSDGSTFGGQQLEFDVEGAVGAAHYCDADGENCYTAAQLRSGIALIGSNANWPGTPGNGDIVFNRAARTVQVYDATAHGGGGGWQPTYTKFMQYNAAQIAALSPSPELGDQITSSDCDLVLTYNGYAWLDLANNQINPSTCTVPTTEFTVTDNASDANFALYQGNWYDTGATNGSGGTIWTNGTSFASADAAATVWSSTILEYYATFPNAQANTNRTFYSDQSGAGDILHSAGSPIVGTQAAP